MILSLFRKDPHRDAAASLYEATVEQARLPWFFARAGAPDTVEGRFEILTVHMHLLLRRLKTVRSGDTAPEKALAQAVFDLFFRNMDDSLRELGVGDLSVGKKIRAMGEAFYGRVGAYETALDTADADALSAALARNVYESDTAPGAAHIARYVMAADAALADQSLQSIAAGAVDFPAPESTEESG